MVLLQFCISDHLECLQFKEKKSIVLANGFHNASAGHPLSAYKSNLYNFRL